MTIAELIVSEFKRVKQQWGCKHCFVIKRRISGERALNVGYNQVLECKKCGKLKYRKSNESI